MLESHFQVRSFQMKKLITRDEWSKLILLLAILLGVYIRFSPTMLAEFAINDGGMFAVMIDDLRENQYLVPAFTTYNHLNIPYAYPPVGFYIGALISGLFSIDSVEIVRWMPALFASLCIPAFYFLSLRLLKDKYKSSIATMVFAFMPRAFFWFVMGGGLTRSAGQFFMLIALIAVIRLYEESRRADIFWAGLFGGMAVMSHPEASVHTALSGILIWFVISRRRIDIVNSVYVGLIVLSVSAPWWGTLIYQHGLDPLLSAMQTGGNSLAVFHLIFFAFTEEPFMTIIAVLALVGTLNRIIHRDFLLPLWMAVPFFAAGRSATNLAVLPLAMLAAVGLTEVILPAFQASVKGDAEKTVTSAERNILIYVMVYLVFSAYQFGLQLSYVSLSSVERRTMEWVNGNTPPDSRFLILSGATSAACDLTQEWFPALAGRQSIYTIQGREWTLADDFGSFITDSVGVQRCLYEAPSCLDEKVNANSFDYVYVSRYLRVNNCKQLDLPQDFGRFIEELDEDNRYESVFENHSAVVFKVK
ncbi:MAG TPA: hypothetical protein DCX53_05350 [Anaerolineae bacterium]|nr:hypothetical protein [Anaerolineae bacterium]